MKQVYKQKKRLFFLLSFLALLSYARGQGYVFTGAEAVNFGTVDLATPSGQTWSTFRGASPGYFSAVGTATYTSPSDAYNVDGYVKFYATAANQSFTYPVGTGADLRTLTISGTVPAKAEFATAWIPGDPSDPLDPTAPNSGAHDITSVGSGIIAVSSIGQWDWQDLNDNAAGVTITVSIPNVSALYPGVTASYLRLVGWDGTEWINLSTTGASGIAENSTLSGTMVAGITAIGIGASTTILPLKLVSFTATNKNCNAALAWKTANELNTKSFEVQSSTDGVNFTTAATVAAKGSGNGEYATIVTQANGNAYYRLKSIDRDGASTHSEVVRLSLNCQGKAFMQLYPNPVVNGNSAILSFSTTYKGKATIKLTTTLGQQLVATTIVVTEGVNNKTILTSGLASGVYYITLTDNAGNTIGNTIKLIKQ